MINDIGYIPIIQQSYAIIKQTQNIPELSDNAIFAEKYLQEFRNGQLTKEEYLDLLQDLKTKTDVITDVNILAAKEAFQQSLSSIVTIVSSLSMV